MRYLEYFQHEDSLKVEKIMLGIHKIFCFNSVPPKPSIHVQEKMFFISLEKMIVQKLEVEEVDPLLDSKEICKLDKALCQALIKINLYIVGGVQSLKSRKYNYLFSIEKKGSNYFFYIPFIYVPSQLKKIVSFC